MPTGQPPFNKEVTYLLNNDYCFNLTKDVKNAKKFNKEKMLEGGKHFLKKFNK